VFTLALFGIVTDSVMAWKNNQLGLGLNWCYQSGGNNLFWGLFRNGQPPGPDCGVGCPGYGPGFAPGYGAVQPNTGTMLGQLPTSSGYGVLPSAAAASTVPGHTQSYHRYGNPQSQSYPQTHNYWYPYQYPAAYYGYQR
jgi:hypothetical protein